MAKKRMFSISIVEDDVFLDMPTSSQNLYFHLCMNADDDGFVSPRKIMRICNATPDDLNVLILKRYILMFASGVVVIKHWHKNNLIKKDRYVPSTYQKELGQLTFNEWGVYTEKRSAQTSLLSEMAPESFRNRSGHAPEKEVASITTANSDETIDMQNSGTQMEPQYSIDKVSIVKTNTNSPDAPDIKKRRKNVEKIATGLINEMLSEWEKRVGMDVDNLANRKACAALLREIGKDKMLQLMDGVVLAMDDRYAPRISDFVSLKRKKNDLILWGRKRNTGSVEVI